MRCRWNWIVPVIAFGLGLMLMPSAEANKIEGEAITIRDFATASPYPSSVLVSGVTGTPIAVRLRLFGFSHDNLDDVDVFLVGPNGDAAVVFSDAGFIFRRVDLDLEFSDTASEVIPFDSGFTSQSYRPANYAGNDEGTESIPGNEVGSLNALAAGGVNGLWSLYVSDDAPTASGDGTIDSWELEIETHRVDASGPILEGRRDHTSTLLADGRVLVVGGSNGSGSLSSAEIFDPATGSWSATGNLSAARSQHSAVLLPTGKVLISGGFDGAALTSVEIFDPATGGFSSTASLAEARSNHSSTLLADGRILVVGGSDGFTQRDSAEIFDPSTETWSTTGSLGTPRSLHTATLLLDGRVLVSGGVTNLGSEFLPPTVASAEIFDPQTGTWSPTAPLAVSRSNHSAIRLPDGRVVITGGGTRTSFVYAALTGIEIYNPQTSSWTTAGNLGTARFNHTTSLLPDGRILSLGGSSTLSGLTTFPLSSTEIFDPDSGSSQPGAVLALARAGHASTLLAGGRILVSGGVVSGNYPTTTELYDPTFRFLENGPDLATGRNNHTSTLLPDGRVLVVGGEASGIGSIASAEIYNPDLDSWSPTGSLGTDRFFHTATLLGDGRVLVTGGSNGSNDGLASAEIFDPATGIWSPAPAMRVGRGLHTATLLSNGQVLVGGGWNDESGYVSECEIFDPATGTWSSVGQLATARYDHTATPLADGRVLVVGGEDSSDPTAAVEIFDPTTRDWTTIASLGTARSGHSATLLPDGRVLIAGGSDVFGILSAEIFDPETETWSLAPDMPTPRANHTATLLNNGMVILVGGGGSDDTSIFDPSTNQWFASAPLLEDRSRHRASLLLDGRVLITGGSGFGGSRTSTEIYQIGRTINPAGQSVINSLTFDPDGSLSVGGSNFRRLGASGGNAGESSTDYPLVQLRRLDSGLTTFLQPDPEASFTSTNFASGVRVPYAGYVLVTVFVNGVPSVSAIGPSTLSSLQDFDGDGLNDAAEGAFSVFGLDPMVSQPALAASFDALLLNSGYFNREAYDANFTAGEDSVLQDPAAFDLYTLEQIQDLNIGTPLIGYDPVSGLFTLTIAVEKSLDLVTDPFSLFPMSEATTTINSEGELEFTFPGTNGVEFFRLNSR